MRHGREEESDAALTVILGKKRIHNKHIIINEISTSIQNQAQKSLKDQVSSSFYIHSWFKSYIYSLF